MRPKGACAAADQQGALIQESVTNKEVEDLRKAYFEACNRAHKEVSCSLIPRHQHTRGLNDIWVKL